jgi:hypothetical protein
MGPFPGEVGDVPGLSSAGVFLSYRREDAAPYARLLQLQLSERFPNASVFMDLDSIEAGLDFAEVIRLASGDWNAAVEAGIRGVELGEQNGYHRAVFRTWCVLVHIASAQEDLTLLHRAWRWWEPRRERIPRSPFGLGQIEGVEVCFREAGIAPARAVDYHRLCLHMASGLHSRAGWHQSSGSSCTRSQSATTTRLAQLIIGSLKPTRMARLTSPEDQYNCSMRTFCAPSKEPLRLSWSQRSLHCEISSAWTPDGGLFEPRIFLRPSAPHCLKISRRCSYLPANSK